MNLRQGITDFTELRNNLSDELRYYVREGRMKTQLSSLIQNHHALLRTYFGDQYRNITSVLEATVGNTNNKRLYLEMLIQFIERNILFELETRLKSESTTDVDQKLLDLKAQLEGIENKIRALGGKIKVPKIQFSEMSKYQKQVRDFERQEMEEIKLHNDLIEAERRQLTKRIYEIQDQIEKLKKQNIDRAGRQYMSQIPHLPVISLNPNQICWLKEAWRILLTTANNPSYKTIRLNTLGETGEDFDPTTIDQRLVKEKSTQITLLGVLHIERETTILENIDKTIFAIRKKLLADTSIEDFMIGDVAEEIGLEKSYTQIIFSLASMYGNFWNGASSTSTINSPYGYERFSITNESTFDSYIKFKGITQIINDYYKKQEEYDRMSKESFTDSHGILGAKLLKSQDFGVEQPRRAGPFTLEIFKDTRGYLQEIANEASLCYSHGLYNASLVMVRKLCETLIIEAFERHEVEEKILDKDGNYVTLSNLIGHFLAETSWNLGRNTKSGLPKLKKLADASAHNRRFSAKKDDIDNLDELRILIQEIINIIDYPTWKKPALKSVRQPKSNIFKLLPTSQIVDTGIDVVFGDFIKGEIDLSNPFHIDTSQKFPWMPDFILRYQNQGKWIENIKYISPSGMKTYDENGNQIAFEHPEVAYNTWGAIYIQVDNKKYRIESFSIKNSLINTPNNNEMKPLLMETSGRLFIHVNPHPYLEGTTGEITVKIEKSS